MSAKLDRYSAKNVRREVIRGFDAERLKAPFVLRCGALTIDYIVVLFVPVTSLILGRFLQYDGAKLLNSEVNNTGWLITILLCVTNFLIFPVFSGQTIGKMLTGLRLVNKNGTNPGFGAIVMRHLIGYPITLATGMLGFLIVMFNQKGRALHDYLAGTYVVYGHPKRKISSPAVSERPSKRIKGKKIRV